MHNVRFFALAFAMLMLLPSMLLLIESTPSITERASTEAWSADVTVYGPTSGVRYFSGDLFKGKNYFYAYADDYLATSGAYVKRSVDGVAWSSPTTLWSIAGFPSGGFCVYSVADSDHIICSAKGNVKKSVDNGTTYTSLASSMSLDYNFVATNTSMDPNRAYDGDIYIVGTNDSIGIFLTKSVDDGLTWSTTYQVTNSASYYAVLTRDDSKLYCFYRLDSDFNVYVKNSTDWGKTWGTATLIYARTQTLGQPSHAQYLDEHRCLLTISDVSNPTFSSSRGVYGYFWFDNMTFQQVGYETGSAYNNRDGKYIGILYYDTWGLNYTSMWCYFIDSSNTLIEMHSSKDTGLEIPRLSLLPYITNYPSKFTAQINHEYSFNASASGADNGTSAWDFKTNASWLSLIWSNETRCLISGTPLGYGEYWANLTVSDLNSSDYINWTILVHRIPFSPFRIDSNSEFASMATISGWPGDGTSDHPYVITDYEIDATGYPIAIYIGNTTVYFVISNCTISNANVSGNETSAGIMLYHATHGRLMSNNCSSNLLGIFLAYSDYNTIENNSCLNDYYGIFLGTSSHNIIRNNSCRLNDAFGILLLSSSDDNLLIDNTCISNFGSGISLYDMCNLNLITNNTCSFSIGLDGITLGLSSNDNLITGNNCSSNYFFGIDLLYSSSRNVISLNRLYDNLGYGIVIVSANDTGNIILSNAFVGNNGAGAIYDADHAQAYDDGVKNWWNGTAGYGNYWSDWTAPDDAAPFGIVDLSYAIVGGAFSTDCYPLTAPPGSPDVYPPMTTPSLTGTLGTNGWYKSSVVLNLTASDWYSGINSTCYRLGTTGNWTVYSSQTLLSTEGNSTLQFFSTDNAGNNETVGSIAVRIDTKSPVTSPTVTGSVMTLSAIDNTSGVSLTYYRIDGGTWLGYVGPISLPGGNHSVDYYSVDNAGNSESVKSIEVKDARIFGIDLVWLIVIIIAAIAVILGIIIIVLKRKSRKGAGDSTQQLSIGNMPQQAPQMPSPAATIPAPISQPQLPTDGIFCRSCGVPNKKDWLYCKNCGEKLW